MTIDEQEIAELEALELKDREQEVIVPNNGIGVGTVMLLGAAGIGGAILWNKAVKPAYNWIKKRINAAKDEMLRKKQESQKQIEVVESNVK